MFRVAFSAAGTSKANTRGGSRSFSPRGRVVGDLLGGVGARGLGRDEAVAVVVEPVGAVVPQAGQGQQAQAKGLGLRETFLGRSQRQGEVDFAGVRIERKLLLEDETVGEL